MGKVTHGIVHFQKTGEFHPSIRSRRKLKADLEAIQKELKNEIPDMNLRKEILLSETIRLIGCLWLAGLYMDKVGIFKEDELKKGNLELQSFVSKGMISFINTIRLNLISFGLDSQKTEEILNLREYVKNQYGEKK